MRDPRTSQNRSVRMLLVASLLLAACVQSISPTTSPAASVRPDCTAAARAVRDAVSRLGEELARLDLEVKSVGPSCSTLPSDKAAAAESVSAGVRLPKITNGVADGVIESKDLQAQFPGQWTAVKSNLATLSLKTAERSIPVQWCVKRTQVCFETQAAVDALGRVQFEPVLSLGVWQARLEIQPREITRRVLFVNGLGAVVADYKVTLLYRADSCLVTAGTASIDIAVQSFDGGLFQDSRVTDGPVVYKGADTCEQRTDKRDWIRARATIELKTLMNPAFPQTSLSTAGVTKAVTIRFDVSAAGDDQTQVDK
jgi:hypothetical protein